MTTIAADRDVREIALLRLCSLLVAAPATARLEHAQAIVTALREEPDACEALAALDEALAAEPVDTLGAAYERLFGGTVEISPYEGGYEADPFRQARQMADIAGFYAAFGAAAHGIAADRPDHAGCELEFLAFLGARRLESDVSGRGQEAALCAEIEESFLREHAGRWLPSFFATLAEREEGSWLGVVGRLGGAVVADALSSRGIDPEPAGPRAALLSVQADEIECGAEGLTSPIEQLADPHRRTPRGSELV